MFRRKRKLYFQKAVSKLPIIVFSVSFIIGGFFLFRIISTLITANNSTVELIPVETSSVVLTKAEEVAPRKEVARKSTDTSKISVKKPTTASEFYTIQVATFQDRKRAEDLVNQLKGKKHSPLYIKIRGKWFEVCIGKFESSRAGRESLSKLRKDFHDAFTRKLQPPFEEM